MLLVADARGLDWIQANVNPDYWTLTDLAVVSMPDSEYATWVRLQDPAGTMIITSVQGSEGWDG